ncbi:MAG: hypothetical protein KGR26_12595 [Cyanobacteria bacterium REEB65]|nr:hypothetical protein [Cyanobacteria bacterium REEB65]
MTSLDEVRRRAEQYLARDPRIGRWRIRTDGVIALQILVEGAVPPQDRYQIVELLGRPLYRVDRPEGALDALLADLVVVRVDVDGLREEPPAEDPAQALQRLNGQFWVDLWVAVGFLERGKLYQALKWLAEIRENIFAVGRLAADNPMLRDEEAVPEALRPALAQTCGRPEPQAIGQALLFCTFVYKKTRQDAAHRLALAFDEETELVLIQQLEQHFGQIPV